MVKAGRTRTASEGVAAVLRRASRSAGATLGRLGFTQGENKRPLPGDDVVPDAQVVRTYSAPVPAPPKDVWPWVVQLGQERGGFYSYARLENLVGCDITNAQRVVPEWQQREVGGEFRLHPDVALRVASVDPGRAFVVTSLGGERGAGMPEFGFSWAFVVEHEGEASRLVVRERYSAPDAKARAVIAASRPVAALMTEAMLRGIRSRATRATRP